MSAHWSLGSRRTGVAQYLYRCACKQENAFDEKRNPPPWCQKCDSDTPMRLVHTPGQAGPTH